MVETLLDTDILSEIIKGLHPKVVATAVQYRERFGRYTTSTITVMEIVQGFHQFLADLQAVHVLPFDLQNAEMAGRIYADLARSGQPIGLADPMIAAIALRHRLALATGNLNHFRRIQMLGYELTPLDWRA